MRRPLLVFSPRLGRHRSNGDGVIVAPGGWGELNWAPVLPNRFMTAARPTVTGASWTPTNASELQAAINGAVYGDEIVLPAGSTIAGKFRLPPKSGWTPGQYIVVRTSAEGSLLDPGPLGYSTDLTVNQPRTYPQRDLAYYATLTHGTGGDAVEPALDTLPGANGWYFRGIRFLGTSTSWNYGLVYAGPGRFDDSNSLADLSSHFIFQQCCFFNETYSSNFVKLLRIQTDYCAVVNCHFYGGNIYATDSNAIWVFKSRGPILLANNFGCAPGENVLTGGADQPSWFQPYECDDVQVFHNRWWKDRRWFASDPSYVPRPDDGQAPGIKNIFELKFGRRWHFVGNIFDGSTTQGQSGQGLTLKTVNQNANQNTAETCDITVERCLSKNVGVGFYLSALETYNGGTGIPVHDVLVRDCPFICPGSPFLGEANKGSYLAHRDQDLRVWLDHVTLVNGPGNTQYFMLSGGGTGRKLKVTNAIYGRRSVYGVWSSESAVQGTSALVAECGAGEYEFHHNALVRTNNTAGGSMATKYASLDPCYFPADDAELGLDPVTGRLLAGSPALAGGAYASTDGDDLGCRWDLLDAEIAGVEIPAEIGGYGA